MTFLAALRHDRIAAPCLLDGPINGTSFLAWIQQFLLPTLNSGDIVVMDNLGSHKAIAVQPGPARGRRQALLRCRAYSPDLNPIKQVFAKLKTLLRKAEPRTVDATSRHSQPHPSEVLANRVRLPIRRIREYEG